MRGWGPVIEIERRDGGYIATLRDDSREWSTDTTVPRRTMSAKLGEFGMHVRDVIELLRFVDREWLVNHPEEPDPDEWFTISRSSRLTTGSRRITNESTHTAARGSTSPAASGSPPQMNGPPGT